MNFLSIDKQAEIIETVNSASRYLDDHFHSNIYSPDFESMVNRIYQPYNYALKRS